MYKNNKLIRSFNCVNDCVKEYTELNVRQINRCLKKQQQTHKGYSFKYKVEDIVCSD